MEIESRMLDGIMLSLRKKFRFSVGDTPNFYFDHSYAFKDVNSDLTVASTDYCQGFFGNY